MKKTSIRIYQLFKEQIIKHRFIIVSIILLLQATLANYLSFVIRFESLPSDYYLNKFLLFLPLLLFIRLILFLKAGLYKGLWRYASISDLIKIINSSIIGSIIFYLTVRYLIGDTEYPRSIYALDLLLFIVISGGSRLLVRLIRETVLLKHSRKRMLIIGSGSSGEMIVREMRSNKECLYEPIGIIDDDIQKKGLTIHGVPIMGTTDMLPEILEKERPDEILISPADIKKPIRNIYDICKPFNIPLKKLPNINEILENNVYVGARLGQYLINAKLVTEAQVKEALSLQKKEGGRLGAKLVKLGYITEEELNAFLNKQLGMSHMKPISLEDLLQREPVNTDITAVKKFIENKTVIVTGAGGSIGSELCRQIIKYRPSNLLLFDRSENNLYEIDFELRTEKHESSITSVIGDIQDLSYLEHIFSTYKPQIVFHAAAYKHVPLMEYNPIEAVKNNIFGTRNLIEVSSKYGIESFVLISTDKAVNPTSIMGATKRIAEFLTVNMNSSCRTKFTTVRFGNVLGSSGSVLQVFRDQLTKGGPLTITHPDMKRFFMLTDEAVHLVLIASASGKGGEIFVLDMGEPLKIIDLAENFIRLSGFIPHKDVKIVFTGLRPGEKLYEELFDKTERVLPSFHKKIMIAVPEEDLMPVISRYMPELERIVTSHLSDEVIPLIQKMIPSFRNGVGIKTQMV